MGVLEEILEKLNELEGKVEAINSNTEPRKEVFNVEEAADFLRVSQGTIYDLIKKGKIDYVRVGNRKLIPQVFIEEFAEENRTREHQNKIKEM